MITILITGGSGFWGWNIIRKFSMNKNYKLFATYNKNNIMLPNCSYEKIDFVDIKTLKQFIIRITPQIIIHTAAISKVNICNENKNIAYKVNVTAPEILAELSEELKYKLIYFSTDLIFDGVNGNYKETDIPNPKNYYAETKYKGEQKIIKNCKNYIILRIALSYGISNRINTCFTDWMAELFEKKQKLNLYTNQYRTPIFVNQGIEIIEKLLQLNIISEIFHLGGGERINRYNLGIKFANIFGYDKKLINPISTIEIHSDCSLDSTKISRTVDVKLLSVDDGFKLMKKLDEN